MRIDRFLMKVLLKLMWSIGGHGDGVDGLPRLTSADLAQRLVDLRPGDLVLLGNSGVLSHVAVYVGDGRIVHAMATERTMRGVTGSVWDALWRPWRWLRGVMDRTGVIEEGLGEFVDRYERDTWVALRHPALDGASVARGVARVRSLVGRPYDYGFEHADDTWYCTEIAVEFLHAARGGERPTIPTRLVRVPGLLSSHVIEPVSLFGLAELTAVAANPAARERYATHLAAAAVR